MVFNTVSIVKMYKCSLIIFCGLLITLPAHMMLAKSERRAEQSEHGEKDQLSVIDNCTYLFSPVFEFDIFNSFKFFCIICNEN